MHQEILTFQYNHSLVKSQLPLFQSNFPLFKNFFLKKDNIGEEEVTRHLELWWECLRENEGIFHKKENEALRKDPTCCEQYKEEIIFKLKVLAYQAYFYGKKDCFDSFYESAKKYILLKIETLLSLFIQPCIKHLSEVEMGASPSQTILKSVLKECEQIIEDGLKLCGFYWQDHQKLTEMNQLFISLKVDFDSLVKMPEFAPAQENIHQVTELFTGLRQRLCPLPTFPQYANAQTLPWQQEKAEVLHGLNPAFEMN